MIYAVIVTHNRIDCLKKVISGVQAQTVQPDQVLIVINGSTDGTKEWVAHKNIPYLLQENLGGAGGFHAGIKKAYAAGATWMWLMDDDVVPQNDCLEQQLAYSSISKCINTVHKDLEGNISGEEVFLDIGDCKTISFFEQSIAAGKQFWYRNTASFEGLLVHRDMVEQIGFPDVRFFMQHDDSLYGWLANRHTHTIVVRNAVMQKLQCSGNGHPVPREYYLFRNLWILQTYFDHYQPELKSYRARRIQWQFLYGLYSIFRKGEKQKTRRLYFHLKAWIHFFKKVQGPYPG